MDFISEYMSGVFGLIVTLVALAVGIYWIVFPLFVSAKLTAVISRLEAIEKQTKKTTDAIYDAGGKEGKPKISLPPVPGYERYYLAAGGPHPAGPHDLAMLKSLKERGVLTDQTFVLIEGGTEWQRASIIDFSTLPTDSD